MGRIRGVDLTVLGSRNIGATNAFRVLGPLWGGLVFVLDAAKGALAVFLARLVAERGFGLGGDLLLTCALIGGTAAIAGHVFTPWLRFRGGRGVATSLGVFLAILPAPTLTVFGLWLALVAISRRVSVGSIGAALVYPPLVWIWLSGAPRRALLAGVATAVALLVIVRHVPNIRRLLAGKEPPIVGGRSEGRA